MFFNDSTAEVNVTVSTGAETLVNIFYNNGNGGRSRILRKGVRFTKIGVEVNLECQITKD